MSRRRFQPRRSESLLSGREMLRLGSMVMLLAVLTMMYFRASDPDTWRFLVNGRESGAPESTPEDTGTTAPPPAISEVEQIVPGPNDADPEQIEALREAAQAISDNKPLLAEEMFAYWRLFDWSRTETFAELWKRAHRGILFGQLFEQPHLHRGELVALDLHIRRVLPHPRDSREADRPAVYEAWGATDESRTFPYCVVFPDQPPPALVGDNLEADARFAGYFLKVMRYEDKLGKVRGAPLLIGRLEWKENAGRPRPAESRTGRAWGWWIAAGGFAALLILRACLRPKRSTVGAGNIAPADDAAANAWLDAAEGHADRSERSP